MKKSILWVLIIFLSSLFINLFVFTNFSYAQEADCPTKYSTPERVSNYISIVNDILSTIYINQTVQDKYENPQNYDSEVTKLWDRALNKAKDLNPTNFEWALFEWLPLVEWHTTDLLANIKILSNSDVVIRDRNSLINLDKVISKKFTDIYQKWTYQEVLNPRDISKINSSLDKLELFQSKDKNWKVSKAKFSDKIKKIEAISFVWRLNIYYKKLFLVATNTVTDDLNVLNINDFFRTDWEKFWINELSINTKYVSSLKDDYACSVWVGMTFWKFWEDFKKNIDMITEDGANWRWKSRDRIKKSYNRLTCTLFPEGWCWSDYESQNKMMKDIKERQRELLIANGYDPDIDNFNGKNMFWLSKAWDNIKEWANFDGLKKVHLEEKIEALESLWREVISCPTILFERCNESVNSARSVVSGKEDLDLQTQSSRSQSIKTMNELARVWFNILDSQSKSTVDSIQEEPKFLDMLPELSKQVYNSIKVLWDVDDKESNTLVWSFWRTCDVQCSNSPWNCWATSPN